LSTRHFLAWLLVTWCSTLAQPAVYEKACEALEDSPLVPSGVKSCPSRSLLQRSIDTESAQPLALASDASANNSEVPVISKLEAAATVERSGANNTQDSSIAEEEEYVDRAFAESLRDPSVDVMAIVGNGPLTDAQREEIKKYPKERIVRFNAMANLLADEPVGHVYANACLHGWWGVTSLVCKRLADAVEIILFGEPAKANEALPSLQEKWGDKFILGPSDGENVRIGGHKYHTHNPNGGFSIGFKGIAYARWRYPQAKLNLYGFSWNAPPHRRGHPFPTEKQAVEEMANVEIHPTAPDTHWHGPPYECEDHAVNITALLQQTGPLSESEAWTEWAGEEFPPEMQF